MTTMDTDTPAQRVRSAAAPAPVLGIDLGTTTSCVAVVQAGEAVVIPSADGGRTLPSVVALTAEGQPLVGQVARRQAATNPAHTVFSAKRLIGRSVDDPAVQHLQAQVPYTVVPGPGRLAAVQLQGQTYVPAQVAALLLAALKAQAEAWLDQSVTQAVITVPAYFDDAQRQATRDAGRIAGLEVLRLVNEPTAAALAYGVSQDQDATIAVYDLGGGTFDISILQVGDGLFEVKSTAGDTHLGGDDIDAALLAWLAEQCAATHGIDPRTDRVARQRLRDAAEDAKIALSSLQQTEITLPFLLQGPQGPVHLHTVVTRALLERLAAPLLAATEAPCRRALADAGLPPAALDAVLLVGGQTRMPAVRALVTEIFGRPPSHAVHPDEAVAVGAARQGAALASGDGEILLLDVTPLTLGLETQEGRVVPLIPRNTPIPVQRTEVCTTATADQTSVEIHVVQGERPLARDNTSLARIRLEDITPGPRGVAQIAVTFTLDADGLLTVSACDGATGRTQRLTVAPTSGLSADAVERLIADAARQRERDAQQLALIALRTEVEAGIGHAAQALQAQGAGAPPAVREALEWAVTALAQALPTGDVAQIRSRLAGVVEGTHALQESRGRSDAA